MTPFGYRVLGFGSGVADDDSSYITATGPDGASVTSETQGYVAGGTGTAGVVSKIERFDFASDGNFTDHGDLSDAYYVGGGAGSTTHGYVVGGQKVPAPNCNNIDKFAYASNTTSTDIGDMGYNFPRGAFGTSAVTHGYFGSYFDNTVQRDVIERVSFASDGNSVDWADIVENAGNGREGYQI